MESSKFILDTLCDEEHYVIVNVETKEREFKISKNHKLEDVIRTLDCSQLVDIRK